VKFEFRINHKRNAKQRVSLPIVLRTTNDAFFRRPRSKKNTAAENWPIDHLENRPHANSPPAIVCIVVVFGLLLLSFYCDSCAAFVIDFLLVQDRKPHRPRGVMCTDIAVEIIHRLLRIYSFYTCIEHIARTHARVSISNDPVCIL